MLERGGLLFPNESVIFREKVSNQYEREEDGSWRIKLQTEFTILVGCSFFIYTPSRGRVVMGSLLTCVNLGYRRARQ